MSPTVVAVPHRTTPASRRGVALLALLLLAVFGVGIAGASSAHAYGIVDFKAGPLKSQADGAEQDRANDFSQSAGRPTYGITDFTFAQGANDEPVANTKNVRVDIPAGLTPNPRAVPTCSDADLLATRCAPETQVGVSQLTIRGTLTLPLIQLPLSRQTIIARVPVFNMERRPGQVARFSFNPRQAPGADLLGGDLDPIDIVGGVRSEDAGLFFTITDLPQDPATIRSKLIFWGQPGADMHNRERTRASADIPALEAIPLVGAFIQIATADTGGNRPVPNKTRAFLTNPSSCAGPQTSTVATESYAGERASRSYATPVGISECETTPFGAEMGLGPQQVTRDSPSGLEVGLRVPQNQDSERGTGHVKDVSLTLPPGATISPSVANGLETCSDAAFKKGTNEAIDCPAASRIGSTEVVTPLLDNPLTGNVYLGDPMPGDRYRLLINADGPGFSIRLTGSVKPDPKTGQLTTVVSNAPQVPFSDFNLRFDGGPRAVIATPQTCDTATGSASLAPWAGTAPATPTANLNVTGCEGGFNFAPAFGAKASPTAGAFQPLSVSFGRNDGDQFLEKIAVDLPPGLLAKIKGVTRCSEAQVAAAACPAASRVGTASVQAGPGSAPYGLSSPVYLTNAYGGGNFGFATIIRAIAGPYDLGNVTVRQAIKIDPNDAHVSVVSDPLPQIQEGILLRLRALELNVNRAGFTRNPTSCGPKTLTANLGSPNGGTAQRTTSLTFADCAKQKFAPKMRLSFTGKKDMKAGRNPGVTAKVTQKEGEAGIKYTTVVLPKSVALASSNANTLCPTDAALQDKCGKNTIVGSASAETPILGTKLSGPVYFVKGQRTTATGKVVPTLPTLFVKLQGEATIYLRAVTAVNKGRLTTTFPAIPDAPLTNFTFNIRSGKGGIINANADLCAKRQRGSARLASHSGAQPKAFKTTIATACGKSPKLKVRSIKRSGTTLLVKGTVTKKAKGRVTARVTCGKTTVRTTATPKKGRWTAKVRLTKGCSNASKATLKVGVASKGAYASQTAKSRKLKLRF
ncbi:hypothetical protein [Patulibacter americanus]|uniref:hypothetical protein n=1 Tax=Patulibacter americanus TaxID=588672 RepID=UPI00040209D7|nr:hypothetical protein [Patulibacter americanus]